MTALDASARREGSATCVGKTTGKLFQGMRPAALFINFSLLGIMVTTGIGCNDPLPTYTEPTVTVATIVPSAILDTVLYVEYGDSFGPDSLLEIMPPNPIDFTFYEENQYQETLYGAAAVQGKLDLWVVDHPDIGATIPITIKNIVPGPAYDSKTGILVMDPGQLVQFQVLWNLKDSKGNRIYHDISAYTVEPYVGLFNYDHWKITSMKIHVRVTIQLFAQTSAFVGELEYGLVTKGGIVYLP
ncbi:MAG TPA: hypothetical protein VMM58_13600 [Bacteroidota bacterium]|nr:hypothetical protein [Bacteroidota bacterium]